MSRIKMLIISMLATVGLVVPALTATTVNAQPGRDQLCRGVLLDEGQDCDDLGSADAEGTVTGIANTVINVISLIVGIVSVIMIIFAGFQYVTSGGGDGTKKAKDTILYAIIGLIVVLFAQTVVRFVISRVIG